MIDKDIIIFDTSLRDGEQAPGFSMTIKEKLTIAHQLATLGVDVIEAGFPIASKGDFEAVRQVSSSVEGVTVAGLARVLKKDIDAAGEALRDAQKKRIHVFVATSDIHLQFKLKKTRKEVLEAAILGVTHAKQYTDDIEFSAEDASRSDPEFLCEIIEKVIDAGAGTVNIPDTVGYAVPHEFGNLIHTLVAKVPNIAKAIISVHCHNDLGLAVANSISAITNGARQVECTVNGIGERAGNASLEEIVMILATRKKMFDHTTKIRTRQIYKTSKLLSNITGITVQPNKAIVGANAFAHEAGIHQDGVLKNSMTYEIMTPLSVGLIKSTMVMGKHSGRHAFTKKLESLNYMLKKEEIDLVFERFKALADKKKEIFDDDLKVIVEDEIYKVPETYSLLYLQTTSGNKTLPTATVRLTKPDKTYEDAAIGDGPVDAAYKAIDRITGLDGKLLSYSIRAVTEGKDAIGEVTIKVMINNTYLTGKGASTDIIEASVKAYIQAVNRVVYEKNEKNSDKST